MNTLLHIRRHVFGITQAEMGAIACVRQATVSRWERGLLDPTLPQLRRIRAEARRRRLRWKDSWFFDLRDHRRQPALPASLNRSVI